jgi:tRNA-dihydrouridine synthase
MMNFWQSLPRPIIGLAPMDGVTDAAFRLTVARHGPPDVTFTEFTSVMDVCRGPERVLGSLIYGEPERPIVAQLYGNKPEAFYQAAHVVGELGFDGLDINMGCPAKNVASSGSGAALIRTPALAHEIMRAAREGLRDWAAGQSLEAVGLKPSRSELVRRMNLARQAEAAPRREIPLSVKTRLGYDSVVIESWVGHLLEERPAVISIHGRTLAQQYRGEADWEAIARAAGVARGTDTLVFGNGDVHTLQEAAQRIRRHRVDGVLVGRAALGAPWFFRNKEWARCAGSGDERPEPVVAVALPERFRIMLEHARQFEALFGQARFPAMRKHLGWYCRGFRDAATLRGLMFRATTSAHTAQILEEFFLTRGGCPADPEVVDPALSCLAQ